MQFTETELKVIKELAKDALSNCLVSVEGSDKKESSYDLSVLPANNFDEDLEYIQNLQSIVKRCDGSLFKQGSLFADKDLTQKDS